jgi:hypothetical protein
MIKYLLPILLLAGCDQSQVYVAEYNCMDKTIPVKAEQECRHIREFKRPQMQGGCVYQESQGKVIKTCG